MRTPAPGTNLVPRWRTKMAPGLAVSPANNLIPKYLGCESLKFLVEPPALVCAIIIMLSKSKNKIKYWWGSHWLDCAVFLIILLLILLILGFWRLGQITPPKGPIELH